MACATCFHFSMQVEYTLEQINDKHPFVYIFSQLVDHYAT